MTAPSEGVRPDLDAIQARADAATPGPWTWDSDHGPRDCGGATIWYQALGGDGPCIMAHEARWPIAPEDMDFIAAARSDIPALIAECRRLRALVEDAFREGFQCGISAGHDLSSRADRDDKLQWRKAEARAALPLRLAYAGLWCLADREGRFLWKPRELKVGCLPHDLVDFAAVLDALSSAGFIVRYEVEGHAYGVIPTFLKYQKIHPREAVSRIPAPPEGSPKANLGAPKASQGSPKVSKDAVLPRASASTSASTSTSASASVPQAGSLAASPDAAERETAGVAPAFAAMTQIAMRLTIAANHGLRANPALPGFNELVTSNQTAIVSRWVAEGLDVAIAERTIREKAEHYQPKPRNPQPQSLAYFGRAVLDACDRERDRKAQEAAAAEIAEAERHKRTAAPRMVEARMDPAAVPDLKHLMAIEAGKLGIDCEPPTDTPAPVELTAAQKRKAIQDAAEHEARMTRGTLEARGAA